MAVKNSVRAGHDHVLNLSVGGKIDPASQSQRPQTSSEKKNPCVESLQSMSKRKKRKLLFIESER